METQKLQNKGTLIGMADNIPLKQIFEILLIWFKKKKHDQGSRPEEWKLVTKQSNTLYMNGQTSLINPLDLTG